MESSLVSTGWRVENTRTGASEVSTTLTQQSEKGSEQIDIRVIVDGAPRMIGWEAHKAALVRARSIIDLALKAPYMGS